MVNFGKNYKNEVITEWENKYFDYNSVKKITNRNELRNLDDVVYRFKQHDEYVLSEINKINKFYTEKIQDLVCLLESDPFLLLQECDKLRHFILLK